MSQIVREVAPAKLNLSLEILGRRADGYHDLVTIFQTIGLADELSFSSADELTLVCDDARLAGPDNLVLRAAGAMRETFGVAAGARIGLRKRIPVAAGLGGGSSDAAAALRGLARLWGVPFDGRVAALAARLGADVPFLLRGGTALASGVGDRLDWLDPPARGWVVLLAAAAEQPDKTARAYRALAPTDFSDGAATAAVARALRAGNPAALADGRNGFDAAADRLFSGVAGARARLRAAGAPWARLSGAGPTVFTIVPDGQRAEAIRLALGADALVAPLVAGVGDRAIPRLTDAPVIR